MHKRGDRLFGQYKIIEDPLQTGGMSEVYKAEDQHAADPVNRLVAIKMIDPPFHSLKSKVPEAELIDRFEREANLLQQLNHPAIPRFHNFRVVGGRSYLIMDWVEGKELRDWINEQIANRVQINQDEVLSMTTELLDLLDHLHRMTPPVIYRDLKPENVKLRPNGRFVLLDFGIIKHFVQQTQLLTRLTQPLGTPGYAPMEIYTGQPVPRTDIWCLGWIMAEILTGQGPHPVLATAGNPPPPPDDVRKLRPDVCAELAALIAWATKPDANDRPTAREMLEDIKRIQFILHPPVPKPVAKASLTVTQAAGKVGQTLGGVGAVGGSVVGGVAGILGSSFAGIGHGLAGGWRWGVNQGPKGTTAFRQLYGRLRTGIGTRAQAVGTALGPPAKATAKGIGAAFSFVGNSFLHVGQGVVQGTASAFSSFGRFAMSLDPRPVLKRAKQRFERKDPVAECETWATDAKVFQWKSKARQKQAKGLVQAMKDARALAASKTVLDRYIDDFWALVFEDRAERLKVQLTRDSGLSGSASPVNFLPVSRLSLFTRLRRSWRLSQRRRHEASLTRRARRKLPPLAELQEPREIPASVLTTVRRLVQNGQPRLRPQRIGFTRFSLDGKNFRYQLYILIGHTWFQVQV